MISTRQNKVARLLQKEIGDIFLKEGRNKNILITVTIVRISPDLSQAKIYLSLFPPDKSENILPNINQNSKQIRFKLAKRVRHQLRAVPELTFFLDDSLDYYNNMEGLLND